MAFEDVAGPIVATSVVVCSGCRCRVRATTSICTVQSRQNENRKHPFSLLVMFFCMNTCVMRACVFYIHNFV